MSASWKAPPKSLCAHRSAVRADGGPVCAHGFAVCVGVVERAADRAGAQAVTDLFQAECNESGGATPRNTLGFNWAIFFGNHGKCRTIPCALSTPLSAQLAQGRICAGSGAACA